MKESSRNRKFGNTKKSQFVCTSQKVRPHKARQKKPRAERGKTGQDRTRPGATKSDKTQQDKTRQDEARRGGTRQSKTSKRKTVRGRPRSVMGYTLLPCWPFWLFFYRARAFATTSKKLIYLFVGAPCANPMVNQVSLDINSMVVSIYRKLQRHGVVVR